MLNTNPFNRLTSKQTGWQDQRPRMLAMRFEKRSFQESTQNDKSFFMSEKNMEKGYIVRVSKFRLNGHFIRLLGDQIWFKGQCLNLSHRPKILELVRVFFKAPHRPKSLQDILSEICQYSQIQDFSERYQRSVRIRLLKNLQRCRALFNRAFPSSAKKNRWVFHDRRSQKWTLFGICPDRMKKKIKPLWLPQLQ